MGGNRVCDGGERISVPQLVTMLEFITNMLPEIATTDSFQGCEREIVIISMVRKCGKGLGFLTNGKRANVILTRAKYIMIIVGDMENFNATYDDCLIWNKWFKCEMHTVAE